MVHAGGKHRSIMARPQLASWLFPQRNSRQGGPMEAGRGELAGSLDIGDAGRIRAGPRTLSCATGKQRLPVIATTASHWPTLLASATQNLAVTGHWPFASR